MRSQVSFYPLCPALEYAFKQKSTVDFFCYTCVGTMSFLSFQAYVRVSGGVFYKPGCKLLLVLSWLENSMAAGAAADSGLDDMLEKVVCAFWVRRHLKNGCFGLVPTQISRGR